MKEQGERKITYDMVDKLYFNNNNNMVMAESFAKTQSSMFDSTCEQIFTNSLNSDTIHKNICRTLLAFYYLSHISNHSNDSNNYCGYSNYWVNKQVREEDGTLKEHASDFFNIFSSFTNNDFTGSECKRYIYDLGDYIFGKMKMLFNYTEHYSNFTLKKKTDQNLSCTFANKCANMYKEHIVNCSTLSDEFCTKLKEFKNTLMEQLKSPNICAAEQEIILSIDRTMAESSFQKQSEEHTRASTISASTISASTISASTISASTFGTTMGVPLVLLLLYKFTPFGSWLSPQIGNIKNRFNISDNEQNDSLFNYSELNSSNEQYNVPYNIIGN
ncbi:PIR Superfamily Protein [Plasmodium ovale curtisi]|uniref:PIR Superfamily Protein n=1 Tax=Plasmodium ovale curtisi TaxID=864141 RepID=A0A1A8WM02_PLAOA|nr:PIR Superfamily Protein [Plasmodium ovale curtisi]